MVFDDSDRQRAHYHTDHHRFNLKRQAAGLPPITVEEFNKRLAEKEAEVNDSTKRAYNCTVCRKGFGTAKMLAQHMNSKKHAIRARKEGVPVESGAEVLGGEDTTEDNAEVDIEKLAEEMVQEKLKNAIEIPVTSCLFCGAESASMKRNVEHMGTDHGFFIPYVRYIVNLKALLDYLGQKIGTGNSCLQCTKMFRSVDAVRQHMVSVPHSRMVLEDNWEEYGEFYDFSLDDTFSDIEGAEDADEEVADDDAAAPSSDAGAIVPRDVSTSRPRGSVTGGTIGSNGFLMTTKKGDVIGHRALRVYYRQRYTGMDSQRAAEIRSLMHQYRTMGALQQIGKHKPKTQKKHERDWHERQQRILLKTGKAHNYQKHFREQVMF